MDIFDQARKAAITMEQEIRTLRARNAELEKFIEDLAQYGFRADLQPTVNFGMDRNGMYAWWSRYMQEAQLRIQHGARKVLNR